MIYQACSSYIFSNNAVIKNQFFGIFIYAFYAQFLIFDVLLGQYPVVNWRNILLIFKCQLLFSILNCLENIFLEKIDMLKSKLNRSAFKLFNYMY